jgi:GNAT superfamily N-acetyltransferase
MKNRLIRLFYKAEDYFFRSISEKSLDLKSQATGYYTGIPSDNFNLLIIKEKIPDIENILASTTVFFKENPAPWSIVIEEDLLTEVTENNIKRYGFSYSDVSVAMFLDIETHDLLPNMPNLIIADVNNKLDHWAQPLLHAFESTIEITNQYRDVHLNALKTAKNFYHFSCYQDEIPVASLTLTINKGMARIDDVGTLPFYQNKGIATYLIHYAIGEAKRLGVTYCFLEASASGLSVYQKIGFQPLFKNRIYNFKPICTKVNKVPPGFEESVDLI